MPITNNDGHVDRVMADHATEMAHGLRRRTSHELPGVEHLPAYVATCPCGSQTWLYLDAKRALVFCSREHAAAALGAAATAPKAHSPMVALIGTPSHDTESLPAIGSRWRHSGKGDCEPTNERLQPTHSGWCVERISDRWVTLTLPGTLAGYNELRSAWPGEWSPDEEMKTGEDVGWYPAVGSVWRCRGASDMWVVERVNKCDIKLRRVGQNSFAWAEPRPMRAQWEQVASSTSEFPTLTGEPLLPGFPACALPNGSTIIHIDFNPPKPTPPLSPAEAVERAVREAPSSLNKEALRAALVMMRPDGTAPLDPGADVERLFDWLAQSEAERRSNCAPGTAYLRALAAIQAPKMHRPHRWSQFGGPR